MKNCIQVLFFLVLSASCLAQQKKLLQVNDFEKAVQVAPLQLLDVRTPAEFGQGYIKGAVNANWQDEQQFAAQAAKLNKTRPVYLYCLSGVRSGKAADWLLANGFSSVINLEGGMKAWLAASKPVVTP